MDARSHTRGVRTSSRNVGSHDQHQQPRLPVKLETSSIDSHEDEEDDGDGNDDAIMSDEQDLHVLRSLHYNDDKARSDQVKGYLGGDAQDDKIIPSVRPVRTASKPARVSKRRDSTVKRKEQNRIAQRAFRIRKKVYHLELEANAIEAADKIQDMADSNTRLMKMMEKLQKENTALKTTRAKANLSSEAIDTQDKVDGPAKVVKRKERTARPKSSGQSLADAMLPINEVDPDVLMDDPLVSFNDLQAGLNDFEGNNKNDHRDVHPVEQPSVTSPGYYETRWTDPVPPPSMTMPSWLQEQQMYLHSSTRPSTSSSSYTPQTRSALSSPVAYIGSLPAQPSGRSGSSRPNTANAREQHIEVINHPTFVYPSDSTTTPRYNPSGSHGQQGAADFSSRPQYSSEVAAPSFPDMTAMYHDQQQHSALRADSVRRYSRALRQHHHPLLHSTGDDGGVRAGLQPGQGGDAGKQVDFSSQGGPSSYGNHHDVRDVWTGSLQPPVQGSTHVMPQSRNVGLNSQPRGPPSWLGHEETYQRQGPMNGILGGSHSGLKVNAQEGEGMMPVNGMLTPVDGLGTMDWSACPDWRKTTATWPPDMNALDTSYGQQSSVTSAHPTRTVSDALGGGGLYMRK